MKPDVRVGASAPATHSDALAAFYDAAYAALAHPGRRAILHLLCQHGPMTATRIARRFDIVTRRDIAFHLQRLHAAGLVRRQPRRRMLTTQRERAGAAGAALLAITEGRIIDGRERYYSVDAKALLALGIELNRTISAVAEVPAGGASAETTVTALLGQSHAHPASGLEKMR